MGFLLQMAMGQNPGNPQSTKEKNVQNDCSRVVVSSESGPRKDTTQAHKFSIGFVGNRSMSLERPMGLGLLRSCRHFKCGFCR